MGAHDITAAGRVATANARRRRRFTSRNPQSRPAARRHPESAPAVPYRKTGWIARNHLSAGPRDIHLKRDLMMARFLAFDLGAESGRAMTAHLRAGVLDLAEVARFPNEPVRVDGSLYWDAP